MLYIFSTSKLEGSLYTFCITVIKYSMPAMVGRLNVFTLMRPKHIDANRYEAEPKLGRIATKLSVTATRNYHISRLF